MKILTIKNYILPLFFIIVSASLFSQGLTENDLTTNHVLVKKWNELTERSELRASSITDTISLDTVRGILDDFSYTGPYPDTALWLDKQVFINRGYGRSPVTIGTATFDGLDANGYPYDFMALPTSSSSADSLTSKPINLKYYLHNGNPVNYTLLDSLYFSFFYQPQGNGNAPEPADSLVLEFTAPGLSSWKTIWEKAGTTIAATDSSWKLVMIPIKNPAYLQKGFQFRFRNYATISGNLDHWNIDYVYLNKHRVKTDTLFEDVSFVYNAPSLLNTYTAMPWNHYNSTFMKSTVSNVLRNNYSQPKNVNFYYKIYDQTGTPIASSLVTAANVLPFSSSGYDSYTAASLPVIPVLTDTSKYLFETVLKSSPDLKRGNDTLRRTQDFSNFYSYDDGSAETAFGLSTLNAQMAEKFTSTIPDTLRCIDIYFNPVLTNANLYSFVLNVWGDGGGTPGTAIYTGDSVVNPYYTQTGRDQFIRYYLNHPLYLSAGTFYIGFTQKTTQFLNVGVDRNINTQDKIFYNVSGGWSNPPFPGSLLMHPVFGAAHYFTGINTAAAKSSSITVYPNPANDKLFIKFNSGASEKINYSITDLFGRVVLENKSNMPEYIDISSLSEGVYFIRITDGTQAVSNKFIKVN